jgi:hypothetical protein
MLFSPSSSSRPSSQLPLDIKSFPAQIDGFVGLCEIEKLVELTVASLPNSNLFADF